MPGLLTGGGAAVDLSLPSEPELVAAATPNPAAEAARVTETGQPEQIRAVGQGFLQAGVGMDAVFAGSHQAQQAVGASFSNDGRPVYDAATHKARLPGGFRDAGTELHDMGRRLGAVADELGSAITDVTGSLDRLRADLAARRAAWAAQVQAATGPDGLIPAMLVPALQARRTTVVAGMQQAAGACGRDVASRIDRYNQVLNDCVRLTSDLSVVGGSGGVPTGVGDPAQAAGRQLGALSARFEGGTAALVFPTPGFAPAPQGPLAEVTPLPPLLPDLPGFVPAPGGPSIAITPPAPDLALGRTDQGQLDPGGGPFGAQVDADAHGRLPDVPLSQEDHDKLFKYLGPGFRTINPALRGETPLTPEIQSDADDVSSVLAKLPPTSGTVYRGTQLTDDQLARYQPGTNVTEPTFTSSSLRADRAFGGNVTFTIDSVDGKYTAPYARQFAPQEEVTFDRGTSFRVLSREVDPATGRTEIELREVPK